MKYYFVVLFLLVYNSINAQINYENLLKEIWERDTCTLKSHRDILASFITKNELVNTPKELKELLGEPLHINYRKNGDRYYVYVANAASNHFYKCNILSLIVFKFDGNNQLRKDELHYFIGDMEEEHSYWNSNKIPKKSYQGSCKEPYPFKTF